jgi:centrosomal CEP192-like protein
MLPIQTVAGNGLSADVVNGATVCTMGNSALGGPATSTCISGPQDVFVDSSGNIFFAAASYCQYHGCISGVYDVPYSQILEVVAATGLIQAVAGNGEYGYGGDGGLAINAELAAYSVFVDSAGNLFIADSGNSRIREVAAATGIIQTVAGNGTGGYSGDGGPATSAELSYPSDVFVDSAGNLFIADNGNNLIREVAAATGIIQTVAGNGTRGYSGDGGPATSAELAAPYYLAVDSSGDLLIADYIQSRYVQSADCDRIRSVSRLINIPPWSLSPLSLNFGNQLVGTSSNAQSTTLANKTNTALTISSIAVAGTNSGDFAQTNTCATSPANLGANGSCQVNVTFQPTATGIRTASLTFTDIASGSSQSVALTGTAMDFSLAAATGGNCPSGGNCSTSVTISSGQTATYNLQVSQLGGLSGAVALTCSGAPGASTCSVSRASVPLSGSSNYAFTVTVSNTSNVLVVPWLESPLAPMLPASRMALRLFLTLLMILLSWKEVAKERAVTARLSGLAVLLIVMMASGCAGGGSSVLNSQPPTNATLTITGASGTVKHKLDLSLSVNH